MTLSIPAFCQDSQYPFYYLRTVQYATRTVGVTDDSDMTVTPSSGLQVTISFGSAFVQQGVGLEPFPEGNGLYFIYNEANANPFNTITAPTGNPRVDMVVARVYDVTEQGLGGSSFWRYEWVTGAETAGTNLANLNGAPALPDNALLLAYVLQTVGEIAINPANIKSDIYTKQISGSRNPSWLAVTTTNAGIGQPLAVRLEQGDVIRFRGGIQAVGSIAAAASWGSIPYTVPLGPAQVLVPTNFGAGVATMSISQTGVLSLNVSAISGNQIYLSGVTCSTTVFL